MQNPAEFSSALNLPFSLDAEQSVLGAIILEPSCFDKVCEYVTPESFYLPQHQAIFRAVSSLSLSSTTTILEALKKDGAYEEAEGKSYLMQLADLVPSTANAEAYAAIVREKYYARSLILASRAIIDEAMEGQTDASTLLDSAEQKIYEIRQGKDITGLVHIRDVIVNETFERLSKLTSDEREKYLGLPTGLSGVDRLTTGLNKSDLILLAARPGVGKTSFALNIASHVAEASGKAVAVFSLEMTRDQLVQRMLSSEARVDNNKFKTGDIGVEEMTRIAEAGDVLSKCPIYIDDTSNITVPQMKAKLRRVRNLGLVVIDYLQLMSTGRKDGNRVLEVSEITRNLKIMAKELQVPVLCLSQLSRANEKRDDKRPMLSDLRESGAIEQDADIVLFLYRDDYYNSDSEKRNVAECIVAKNRHGETGKVELRWMPEYTAFGTLENRYDDEE